MRRTLRAATLALVAIVAGAACSPRAAPPAVPPTPAPGPAEAARHRAALAILTVENRTAHALTISFRPATPPGGLVGVGTVAAGANLTLAPVPAGEPIVLLARRADRAYLELDARSFAIGEEWRWVIPRAAVFRSAPEDA